MTRRRGLLADVGLYATIALEATWYCACDLVEGLSKDFKRGWALGLCRARRGC